MNCAEREVTLTLRRAGRAALSWSWLDGWYGALAEVAGQDVLCEVSAARRLLDMADEHSCTPSFEVWLAARI